MTYQNRIDFTVEIFKGLANRVSNLENRAIIIFQSQNKIFEDGLKTNTLIDKIPNKLEYLSGFPGTQQEALTQFSHLIYGFYNDVHILQDITKNDIKEIKQDYTDISKEMDEHLADMCSSSHQIDSIKNLIKDNMKKLPPKFNKYTKSINNIVSLKKKDKKPQKIVLLMEKITKYRSEDSFLQRSNFIHAAENANKQITDKAENAVSLLKKKFLLQKKIYIGIMRTNSDIIKKCNEFADYASSVSKIINFQTDFQNFIDKHKIIRYDILPDPFKPLDFSHECFSTVSTVSQVLSLQLYPYALGKITKEFIAKDKNELTIQKGKVVLLMEDISLPWTFVQNPYTRVMGYVPSSYLEKIGSKLGVLLTDFQLDEEVLSKGDYVAIEGNDEDGLFNIQTINGGKLKVHVTEIGIINEL